MSPQARQALGKIRRLVDSGCFIIRDHFSQRLRERGAFWSEVLAIVDAPESMRTDGSDAQDRARWFLTGRTDAGDLEMLLVMDVAEVAFWTIYWR